VDFNQTAAELLAMLTDPTRSSPNHVLRRIAFIPALCRAWLGN
jgi:hypothetical protein